MPARRRWFLRAFAWLAITSSAFVAACTLDWTVRPEPEDAGGGGLQDAAKESGGNLEDTSTANDVVTADTQAPDSSVCPALFQNLEAARKNARACALASGQCIEKEKELCDCDFWIAKKDGAAAAQFRTALGDFTTSGCDSGPCKGCQTLSAIQGTCVLSGGEQACSPDNRL